MICDGISDSRTIPHLFLPTGHTPSSFPFISPSIRYYVPPLSFHQCVTSPYYASKTVLGSLDAPVKRTERKPCPSGVATLWITWAFEQRVPSLAGSGPGQPAPPSSRLCSHPGDAETGPDLQLPGSSSTPKAASLSADESLPSSSCFAPHQKLPVPTASCTLFFNNPLPSKYSPGVTPFKSFHIKPSASRPPVSMATSLMQGQLCRGGGGRSLSKKRGNKWPQSEKHMLDHLGARVFWFYFLIRRLLGRRVFF